MINNMSLDYPTSTTCSLFGIDTSLYYHWLNKTRKIDAEKISEDTILRGKIEDIINTPAGVKYGYRPMTHQLKRSKFKINNLNVNHKRVLRVMRENNLLCEIKKSFISTTDSNHNLKKHPNLLKKEKIKIVRINQVWVSDITYIRLPEGFVYLAVIIDAYSKKVIGYCLSRRIDKYLVIEALEMAIMERGITIDDELIHHSDQGVQYASSDYVDLLSSYGIRVSMSKKGSPWENGIAESFFKTLKTNEIYLNEYQNIFEAKSRIFNFLDNVYNERRLHSSIGYLPPNEYEKILINRQKSVA